MKDGKSLELIIAIISLGVAIFTLFEMKIERNTAYRPTVLINPSEHTAKWDESGENEWASSQLKKYENTVTQNTDGSVDVSLNLPISCILDTGFDKMPMVNIGVGVAQDILLTWDQSNMETLIKYLIEKSPSSDGFCTLGKTYSFHYNNGLILTDPPKSYHLTYMLSEAKDEYQISLPIAYSLVIQEILKTCDIFEENGPKLLFNLSYKDIQGKHISKDFIIFIRSGYQSTDADGSYSKQYQLIPMMLS